MGQRSEVAPIGQRPELELRDPQTKAELTIEKPTADPSSRAEAPEEEPRV